MDIGRVYSVAEYYMRWSGKALVKLLKELRGWALPWVKNISCTGQGNCKESSSPTEEKQGDEQVKTKGTRGRKWGCEAMEGIEPRFGWYCRSFKDLGISPNEYFEQGREMIPDMDFEGALLAGCGQHSLGVGAMVVKGRSDKIFVWVS